MRLDERPGRLDQRAVLDARRARRLAGTAAEAAIQVLHDGRRRIEAALLQRAHEMDAPARRVGLLPELDVGRARGEAEPAVDAGEEPLGLDEAHERSLGGARQTPQRRATRRGRSRRASVAAPAPR